MDKQSRILKHVDLNFKNRADLAICDFLSAKRLGKKFLTNNNGDENCPVDVDVEILRGKLIALLFAPLDLRSLHANLRRFYDTLSETHDFEMVYVALPPRKPNRRNPYSKLWNDTYHKLLVFNDFVSTLLCPFVPFVDKEWRSHIFATYGKVDYYFSEITIISTRDNKVDVLGKEFLEKIIVYGWDLYPFTVERVKEVDAEHRRLLNEELLVPCSSSDFLRLLRFNNGRLNDYNPLGYNPLDLLRILVKLYDDFKMGSINFESVFPYDVAEFPVLEVDPDERRRHPLLLRGMKPNVLGMPWDECYETLLKIV